MKEGKPFFYRIEASEFFAVTCKIPSDKELGKFMRRFASDLVMAEGNSDYSKQVILEAIEYIDKKRKSGSKGGKQRASNAQAPLKHRFENASSETQANNNSSNRSSNRRKEKPYSSDFEVFWNEYPRAIGKGKAWEAWIKFNPPIEKVLDALKWQKGSDAWTKEEGQFIPHPTTYLNQKRWEDRPTKQQSMTKAEKDHQDLLRAL